MPVADEIEPIAGAAVDVLTGGADGAPVLDGPEPDCAATPPVAPVAICAPAGTNADSSKTPAANGAAGPKPRRALLSRDRTVRCEARRAANLLGLSFK